MLGAPQSRHARHVRRTAAVLVVAALALAGVVIAACDLADGLSGGAPDAVEGGLDGGGACDAALLGTVDNCGACGDVCPSGLNGVGACIDGGCGFACTAPFGDCDGKLSTGCETNLNTTRTSCGRCGHDCQGGGCNGGACQPYLIEYGADTPAQIVTTERYVYGINAYGTVSRVAKDGGSPVPLVAGGRVAQARAPRIALANDTLYYTSMVDDDGGTDGGIYQLALDGGKPTVLAPADQPLAILAGPTSVTWSEGNGDGPTPLTRIKRCKIASCASSIDTLLPSTPGVIESLAIDGTSLYWANLGSAPDYADGNVSKCVTPACDPVVLAAVPNQPFDVVVDKVAAYWTSMGGSATGAISSCSTGQCSGIPTPIDTFQYRPGFIVSSGTLLFWTSRDGSVKSINKVPPFNEHLLYQNHGTWPWALVVEIDAIYFTDLAGAMGQPGAALYKLAR